MMTIKVSVIIIIVLILPLILSLRKVWVVGKAKSISDFFLNDRKMDSSDFINTTVSYGYQVAAISLFAYWGFTYGFWTIWVPIFWAAGFYILRYLNDNDYLDLFYNNHAGNTLHGFLGHQYNYKELGRLAGLTSILGLSGTAFFEADFTSKLISNAAFSNNFWWYIGIFIFFVFIVLIYIIYGGLKTIVITNKVQLSLGFIFFNAFVVFIFIKIIFDGFLYSGFILYTLGFLSVFILNLLYPKFKRYHPANFKKSYSTPLVISLSFYIIGAVYVLFSLTYNGIVIKDSYHDFFMTQNFCNILSLGWVPLISLLLANALWQIVDVSNWQRMAAINDTMVKKEEISRTLTFIGYYSAITWIIAILFGMGLKYYLSSITDASLALQEFTQKYFLSQNIFEFIFIISFFFSLIFIMLSTLDSLISAISYTTYYDVIYQRQKKLSGARIWTFIYTIVFLLLYILIRLKVNKVDDILYTFYSFQLALFPCIIVLFFNLKFHKYAAYSSIIGGIIGTLIPFFVNSGIITPYTFAAIASISASSITLVGVNFFFKNRQ